MPRNLIILASHQSSRPDSRYEKLTQDNQIATTEKSTAVKYKTKDQKETEAALVGLKEDADGTSKELAAILESSVCLCYDPAR